MTRKRGRSARRTFYKVNDLLLTRNQYETYKKAQRSSNIKRGQSTSRFKELIDNRIVGGGNVVFRPTKLKNIEDFENIEQFERALSRAKNQLSRNLSFNDRANIYKENVVKALQKNYGATATQNIVNNINQMSNEEFQKMILQHGDDWKIKFIYESTKFGKKQEMLNLADWEEQSKTR